MIQTLVSKIAGLFEKDFLFASFLPALLFLPVLGITFAFVTGLEAVWAIAESLTTLQSGTMVATASLCLVVFAYVLSGLRPAFTGFWAGITEFPFYLLWGSRRLAERAQRARFLRMRTGSARFSRWRDVLNNFEERVRSSWNAQGVAPGRFALFVLRTRLNLLHEGLDSATVQRRLEPIVKAFAQYSGNDLAPIYRAVKRRLMDWHSQADTLTQNLAFRLDRRFGTVSSIRPTELGNIIESYNQYPSKRYKAEGELFWSRLLLATIKDQGSMAPVQDSKTALDFYLTMASLATAYAVLALLLGPWLWLEARFWLPLAVISLLTSFFFYRLSVLAAYEYGEMMRASFDLYRLKLMSALSRPQPSGLSVEQKQWDELSRLAVYGDGQDFPLKQGS